MAEFGKALSVSTTAIPGLLVIDLPVHGDARGWFKENWQREKMLEAGLPDFKPVQNNISFNDEIGTTRGIHAEPWDKFVSLATGKIFGAWVDLREGESFGTVFTAELDASKAVFVPRGVANSYQTLEVDTAYVYLVNDHWSADAEYTFVNLADQRLGIAWPIPLAEAIVSEKDAKHPALSEVVPFSRKKTLIIGAGGQLGRALGQVFPQAHCVARDQLDITDQTQLIDWPWRDYDTVINAAAYTDVDEAEESQGRRKAWSTNVQAVTSLAQICSEHGITLVHVSSDYVFDGVKEGLYAETDPLCPLGVYGQTKAAGDIAVSMASDHYVVRTSWVIGDGNNFVRTMARLAEQGINPSVVNDQFGRLSFTDSIANGIKHLLEVKAPYGTYNLTSEGESSSWCDVAQFVFAYFGRAKESVIGVSSAEYSATQKKTLSPRPANSMLDLSKIKAQRFSPPEWKSELTKYLDKQYGRNKMVAGGAG